MAAIASHGSELHGRTELTRESALKTAWYGYLAMLVAPFLLFLFVAWHQMDSTSRRDVSFADGWFLVAVGYMMTIVPASLFVRSRSFAEYWRGGSVSPRNYVLGMYVVWVALEIGGIVSLIGCLVTRSLLPTMLPALAAFMMFVVLWPSGRAMVANHRGASDDPEKYEEPR